MGTLKELELELEINRLKDIIKKHNNEAISQDFASTHVINEQKLQIRNLKKEITSLKEGLESK